MGPGTDSKGTARIIDVAGRIRRAVLALLGRDSALGSTGRLDEYLDQAPDRIVFLDKDLRQIDAFGRINGKSSPDGSTFRGRTISEMVGPELAEIHEGPHRRALAGRTVNYDWSFDNPERGTVWLQTRVAPIENPTGDGPSLVSITRDITPLKKAEFDLRNSELQFTAIFHASPVSIVLSSLSTGHIIDVNDEFLRLTGYARSEVIGLRATDLNLWGDLDAGEKVGASLRDMGRLDHLDSRIRAKDGEMRDTLSSLTVIERGGQSFLLRMDYDITERKRFEEALMASEEKFRGLIESLHDIVVVLDPDLRQVEVLGSSPNVSPESMQRMKGHRPTESAGHEVGRIHEEKALEAFTGRTTTYEWEWRNNDGSLSWFKTNLSPVFGPEGKVIRVVSISHDVTDLKYAEENARRNEEEIRLLLESFISAMATALDARDGLTAGHSHRVTEYALGIGEAMGLPRTQMERIRIAGMMHDMGKINTPDSILKKPSRLTPQERDIIKRHPEYTRAIIRNLRLPPGLEGIADDAGLHHERADGTGYPAGLKGEDIPLVARILAVADVFDAITSERHYRKAMRIDEALQVIREGNGSQFFPECVASFEKYYEKTLKPRFSGTGEEEVL